MKLYHLSVIYNSEEKKLIYDRKLKQGPGNSMYGLEVCKSLDLPFDFLNKAHEIRTKYNKESKGILSKKTSKYNAKKIIDKCELCKENLAVDVHHMQFQKNSNEQGYIGSFNKNHLANLISICKECHDKIHKEDLELKIVKTSSGFELKKL
jgi:DNA mismatch repair protein MutS